MPYFIFRINHGPTAIIKTLDLLKECESYKEAKDHARSFRGEQATDANAEIKMIFADNRLQAEEQILQSREKPILREWEK